MQKYDPERTWRENLHRSPSIPGDTRPLTPTPGVWSWCGLPLDSPLGIPAGPLLDSRWLLYYANQGFDWLVYKTVRSSAHECHPLPNLVPVDVAELSEPDQTLEEAPNMRHTWAVSFGMPSQSPDSWRADVEYARNRLPDNKQLIVSVVATQDDTISDPQASLDQIAADFALCARWAVDSGANGVVANFSCPNVSTADGQLYQQPESAGYVCEQIRSAVGDRAFALKIGWVADKNHAASLLHQVSPWVDGLVMTNSIPAHVRSVQGHLLFDGEKRGICGAAIRTASIQQVAMFRDLIEQHRYELQLAGVGGVSALDHVQSYLSAGAQCVGIATAAMLDPGLAIAIRGQWPQGFASR